MTHYGMSASDCLFRQARWDSIDRSAESIAIVYQETHFHSMMIFNSLN